MDLTNARICTECGHERANEEQASACCTMQGVPCEHCNDMGDDYDGPVDNDDWSGGFSENH